MLNCVLRSHDSLSWIKLDLCYPCVCQGLCRCRDLSMECTGTQCNRGILPFGRFAHLFSEGCSNCQCGAFPDSCCYAKVSDVAGVGGRVTNASGITQANRAKVFPFLMRASFLGEEMHAHPYSHASAHMESDRCNFPCFLAMKTDEVQLTCTNPSPLHLDNLQYNWVRRHRRLYRKRRGRETAV